MKKSKCQSARVSNAVLFSKGCFVGGTIFFWELEIPVRKTERFDWPNI